MVKRGQVTGVETDKGQIQCQYFVNCAGQWAYELGLCSEELVSIPLHACEHSYILTCPWETPLLSSRPVMLFKAHLTSHSRMPGSSGPYSVRPPDPPPEKPVSRSGSNC
ncbi:unnamed protein product [Rangifer tarandus platyrhynchus]|uniref:Uncharacterized protein n=1 Tax=Rangifer tarandus platyrhynchus TaxID=3082113 RepID=A0AC59YWY8_RANTA